MKLVRPNDAAAIARLVEALRDVEPTYAKRGTALAGELPIGFRHDHHRVVLGSGAATFDRGVEGLQSWQAHRVPGVRVLPVGTEIQPGATVVVTLGPGVLAMAAPCRVVAVIDEPDRWGFAYGTLPGHPEDGEEAFVIRLAPVGTVTFEITAFSRPGDAVVRFFGPVAQGLQRWAAHGYLRALRRFVDRNDAR